MAVSRHVAQCLICVSVGIAHFPNVLVSLTMLNSKLNGPECLHTQSSVSWPYCAGSNRRHHCNRLMVHVAFDKLSVAPVNFFRSLRCEHGLRRLTPFVGVPNRYMIKHGMFLSTCMFIHILISFWRDLWCGVVGNCPSTSVSDEPWH